LLGTKKDRKKRQRRDVTPSGIGGVSVRSSKPRSPRDRANKRDELRQCVQGGKYKKPKGGTKIDKTSEGKTPRLDGRKKAGGRETQVFNKTPGKGQKLEKVWEGRTAKRRARGNIHLQKPVGADEKAHSKPN